MSDGTGRIQTEQPGLSNVLMLSTVKTYDQEPHPKTGYGTSVRDAAGGRVWGLNLGRYPTVVGINLSVPVILPHPV